MAAQNCYARRFLPPPSGVTVLLRSLTGMAGVEMQKMDGGNRKEAGHLWGRKLPKMMLERNEMKIQEVFLDAMAFSGQICGRYS